MYLVKLGVPTGMGLRFGWLSERDWEKGPQMLLWGQIRQKAETQEEEALARGAGSFGY